MKKSMYGTLFHLREYIFSEEDTEGVYSDIVLKYFLAEGILCKHQTFVASAQISTQTIIKVSKSIALYQSPAYR